MVCYFVLFGIDCVALVEVSEGMTLTMPVEERLACLQLGAAYDAASGWVRRRPPPL